MAETTAERLQAVRWGAEAAKMDQRVHYRRQVASLETSVRELRRQIADLGIGLVIVDSLGAARGGEPESADLTIRTFNALRSLEVPALCLDHVTKAAGNDASKSFGSVYSHNLARLSWSMDKSQQEGQDPTIVLVNRKRNNGRLLPRMAFRVRVEQDEDESLTAVCYQRVDLVDTDLAPKYAPAWTRVWAALRRGFLTADELAAELPDMSADALRQALSRGKRQGRFLQDTEGRWGNAERDH